MPAPDCMSLVGCSGQAKSQIRLPLSSPMQMPWVEVWIEGNNQRIAVSNISSATSKAVVKSFQFGSSNGCGANIEIVDEEGGNFYKFFQKIVTGNKETISRALLHFRWGWATQPCEGQGTTFGSAGNPCSNDPVQMSVEHTLVILTFTCQVANGLFKFTIEGTDFTFHLRNTRENVAIGKDNNPIPVTQAITELMKTYDVKCKFIRLNPGCDDTDISWKADYVSAAGAAGAIPGFGAVGAVSSDLKGIPGRWNALNRDLLQIARDWINHVVTDKDKGIEVQWDTTTKTGKGGTLIFKETLKPKVKEGANFDSQPYNLGTYIVNGGVCSPVISFSPQMGFNYATVAFDVGGFAGEAVAGAMQRVNADDAQPAKGGPDPNDPNIKADFPNFLKAGIQIMQQASAAGQMNYFSKVVAKMSDKKIEHMNANSPALPISAELRIQGDPRYSDPLHCIGLYVSVLYINPFHIETASGTCDWTVQPPCNSVLTNSNWMILGVFHEIREGSYTTTMKLSLAAPGISIARDAPLGGDNKAPKIQ